MYIFYALKCFLYYQISIDNESISHQDIFKRRHTKNERFNRCFFLARQISRAKFLCMLGTSNSNRSIHNLIYQQTIIDEIFNVFLNLQIQNKDKREFTDLHSVRISEFMSHCRCLVKWYVLLKIQETVFLHLSIHIYTRCGLFDFELG